MLATAYLGTLKGFIALRGKDEPPGFKFLPMAAISRFTRFCRDYINSHAR
jgi:hypothetical protein